MSGDLIRSISENDTIHLRASGTEAPHREHCASAKRRELGVHFSRADRHAVQALHEKAKAFGANVTGAPAELPKSAGGGYGFQLKTPEGHVINIAADVTQHSNVVSDRSKPDKVSHIVLNSAKIEEQTNFFIDLLGFRLSDSTDMMDFVRCSSDHHSIAMSRGDGPSLNHMAYEVGNIDGLMRGAGRLKGSGFNIEWGVGRHGPGNNVFTYFVEPNGFVVEYTTEVQRIDGRSMSRTTEYWRVFPIALPAGVAGHPSAQARSAAHQHGRSRRRQALRRDHGYTLRRHRTIVFAAVSETLSRSPRESGARRVTARPGRRQRCSRTFVRATTPATSGRRSRTSGRAGPVIGAMSIWNLLGASEHRIRQGRLEGLSYRGDDGPRNVRRHQWGGRTPAATKQPDGLVVERLLMRSTPIGTVSSPDSGVRPNCARMVILLWLIQSLWFAFTVA